MNSSLLQNLYQNQYFKILSKRANNLQKHENKPIQQLQIGKYMQMAYKTQFGYTKKSEPKNLGDIINEQFCTAKSYKNQYFKVLSKRADSLVLQNRAMK